MNQKEKLEIKSDIIRKLSDGCAVKEIAHQHNIPRSTIYYWKTMYSSKESRQKKSISYGDYVRAIKKAAKLEEEMKLCEEAQCSKSFPLHEKLNAAQKLYGKYPVKLICRVLDISTSTFYNHMLRRVPITAYEKNDNELKPLIEQIFTQSDSRFGGRKIKAKLAETGIVASERKILKLMKELEITPVLLPKKSKYSKGNHSLFFRNELARDFEQKNPNAAWVSDMATIKIEGNNYYLCVIIDLFSRKLVGAKVSYKGDTNLVVATFKDSFQSRGEPTDLMFHSDRGAPYTSHEFCNLLKSLEVKQSFSRVGNPLDNAVAESFFAIYRKEEANRQTFTNFKDLKDRLEKYVHFYNDYRPHSKVGNKTPNKFEEEYYKNKIGLSN